MPTPSDRRLVGRPDAAGDEARLVGIAAGEIVGGAAGDLCGGDVQLQDVLLQVELRHRNPLLLNESVVTMSAPASR